MTKSTVFTTISPLPAGMSREVVLEFLHNHTEMIDLNPLVIERHFISTPENAAFDERDCVWYSMTDKIDYLPGGKVCSEISYECAFHDLLTGLQTHCRAPLGVDIRSKWTLNGSLPGEPPERRELGIRAPASGLYLREDVDLRCNILMTSFVKKNLKKSHATLVDRLVEKAKLAAAQQTDQAAAGSTSGSAAPAMSHPWLPPTQIAPQPLQSEASLRSYASSQELWPTTPPQPSNSTFVEARKPPPDPTVRYSHTSSHHVPQPYRAASQHSTKAHVYTSTTKTLPDLPVPSPNSSIYSPMHAAEDHPPPPPPSSLNQKQHVSIQTCSALYLDGNLDIVPGPLRIGGSDGTRSRAGTITTNPSLLAAHSRTTSAASLLLERTSSSENGHPVYPHLNPYSPVLTDGSSSPDEPHLPDVVGSWKVQGQEGQGYGYGKGYFDELNRVWMDHPEVLRPGHGGSSGHLSGRLTGPFIMTELD